MLPHKDLPSSFFRDHEHQGKAMMGWGDGLQWHPWEHEGCSGEGQAGSRSRGWRHALGG